MPDLSLGGQRPRRIALVLAYVMLLSLAALALADLGELVAPRAIPATGTGQTGTTGVDNRSAGGLLLQRWLDVVGPSGLQVLLDMAIPGLGPAVPAMSPSGAAAPATYPGLLAYALQTVTSIRIGDPQSLLSAQMPGLRGVTVASRGPIEILPDRPGEGESATPPLGPPPAGSGQAGAADVPGQPDTLTSGGSPTAPSGGWRDLGGPLVAIYHTHASESYLPLVKRVSTDQLAKIDAEEAFADDPDITMVRVGQELAEILAKQYGIPTIHSRRFHDADGRLGAYVQSAQTVERLLREYPTLRVLLDLHRDSPRRSLTTVTVGGKSAARILFLVGTNKNLSHPNWRLNHAFASRLNEVMEELYPGLSRGLMVTESRYNQHYLPHAMLVEFGGVDNTLDEVMLSVRLFAEVLYRVMRTDSSLALPATQSELR